MPAGGWKSTVIGMNSSPQSFTSVPCVYSPQQIVRKFTDCWWWHFLSSTAQRMIHKKGKKNMTAYEVSNRLSIYIALFWSVSEKTFVQILRLFFDALVNKHALRTCTKQIASPSTSATRVRSPYGLGLLLILDLREVFLRASISKFRFHLTCSNIFKWGLESSQMFPQ